MRSRKMPGGAAGFPFRDATAAMLAEIWLPPEEGRFGEAADYPIYDWIGRHRPAPVGV